MVRDKMMRNSTVVSHRQTVSISIISREVLGLEYEVSDSICLSPRARGDLEDSRNVVNMIRKSPVVSYQQTVSIIISREVLGLEYEVSEKCVLRVLPEPVT